MARPREGEGIKRTIVERNGKLYAYECTSHMENGRKVSVSKYIGRIDPETSEVVPKIPEKSKENREKIAKEKEIAILKDVYCGDYGAVHLLHSLQLKMDIGLDLIRSFGQSGKTILAVATALAMGNGRFDEVEATFERTWIGRFYGLSVDSGTLSRLTGSIGGSKMNMERFFELRVGGSEGIVAWDTTINGCHSDMDGMAEWVVNNKDDGDPKQVKTGFATDMRGIPLMYRRYPGTMSDIVTLERMVDDMKRSGRDDAIFVMDRRLLSGANIKFLMDSGSRFVIPANISSKAVRSLLTEFKTTKYKRDLAHRDHSYKVWETELYMVEEGSRTTADGKQAHGLTAVDGGLDTEMRIKAYVCSDSEKYSDESQTHQRMIGLLKDEASRIDSNDPVKAFKDIAGKASKHFDVVADGRRAAVAERPKSMSFVDDRAGLFVMLSSNDITWETMMAAYDARRLTEQAFDSQKSEDKRSRTSDKFRMEGRSFVKFIELMMKCEICAEIRESGRKDLSAGEVIATLNTIDAKCYGSTTVLSEMTKKCRDLFGLFGTAVPTKVIENAQVCDVTRL